MIIRLRPARHPAARRRGCWRRLEEGARLRGASVLGLRELRGASAAGGGQRRYARAPDCGQRPLHGAARFGRPAGGQLELRRGFRGCACGARAVGGEVRNVLCELGNRASYTAHVPKCDGLAETKTPRQGRLATRCIALPKYKRGEGGGWRVVVAPASFPNRPRAARTLSETSAKRPRNVRETSVNAFQNIRETSAKLPKAHA